MGVLGKKLAVVAAGVVLSAGSLAPVAMASGVNAGGAGGGGAPAPAAPAAPASCVKLGGWSNRVGHYKTWGAVWTNLNLSSTCFVSYTVSYVNDLTGVVEDRGVGGLLNSKLSRIIDADFLANNNPYTVTLTVKDASGVTVLQQTAHVSTPPAKTGL